MKALNKYFDNYIDVMIAAVERVLAMENCCRADMMKIRLLLSEFQLNIEGDHRFSTIIKNRVASLELQYMELDSLMAGEKIFGFFHSEEERISAKENRAVKLLLKNFNEELHSLRIFAKHCDIARPKEKLTTRYLRFASF
ncbi:MAG: hypothetical protein HUU54_03910 [Ignavibacteriaceae bacterium]|nr:hypothetical protein [Ignavibacteriaceae bacterium]